MTDPDPESDLAEAAEPESPADPNWNAPSADVLETLRAILESDDEGVLATVVEVEGSAYRPPGAKMVAPASGPPVGHVTAGCLESEIDRLAREVLESGQPRLETFDLTEDEGTWGLGTGCSGVVTVRLEPIGDAHRPIADAIGDGRDIAVCTVLEGPAADARASVDPVGNRVRRDDAVPDPVVDAFADVAPDLLAEGGAERIRIDGADVFVDAIRAPPTLLVIGTGHDVAPIVTFGDRLGYEVVVVGYRGARADPDRFPAADRVVSTSPNRLRDAAALDERTYAVVATHNFVDDRLTLAELLESPAPYVGVVGPRERFADLRAALEDDGHAVSAADLVRCYAPVGLDLGGGSPREIALSVVSEVQAVRHGREPKHLSERAGSIHGPGPSLEDEFDG